ncbi:MAG: transposase [Myxococcota bacterium]
MLKILLHRQVDWSCAKNITLKKMLNGRWYACIVLEFPVEEHAQNVGYEKWSEDERVGVDVGLSKLATTSDGTQFEHPRFLRKSAHKLRKEQRKLSKKKRRSKNWEKQRQRVAKVHHKIACQRLDFLHKLSLWLVLRFSCIAFEALKIPAMVRNPRFAKSILDAGWGTLIELTTYKSVKLRGSVHRVDPRYTTQDCSRCGHRVPKTLAQRIHHCPKCGLVMDRDQNAALNIKNRVGVVRAEPGNSA